MVGGPITDVVRYLRSLVGLRAGADVSDAQLLHRFASAGDAVAFEALVKRHGPLVLGVCRRLLFDPRDVEDAFQATFLVLVRKASTIGRGELLANWLYGVAHRVAVRARTVALRRRDREHQAEVGNAPEPVAESGDRELQPLLHEEVSRLPDKYRMPVVLCYLEGKTNEEAARELGWPTGTVSGRLARARDLLRRRLVRRGLALSLVTAALVAEEATATVPPELLAGTLRMLEPESAPVRVTALAEGVMRAMFLHNLKNAVLTLLVVGLLVAGAGLLVFPVPAADPPPKEPPAPADNGKPVPAAKERFTLKGHEGMVWAATFSPDGKSVATVSGLYNKPGELVLWDAASGKEKARAQEPKGIRAVAFSPDGKLIATADYYDNNVRLRDPATGKVLNVLAQGSPNNAVAFSPDGKILAVGLLQDKSIKLWDVAGGQELRTLRGHEDWVPHVTFSPDGKLLASGGRDKTVRLWDVATGQERARLRGHEGTIECVAFSPDGRTLASACWDQTVKLWEVATGKERATLKGHKLQVLYVAFTPDGRTLATTSGEAESPITDVNEKPGEIKLWDALTGQEYASLKGQHNFRVWCVVFGSDGKSMATAAEDKTVKLWDFTPRPRQAAVKLSADELDGLWKDLSADDAAKGYGAVAKLTADGEHAVPFLGKQLRPAPAADPEKQQQIAKLVSQLDDDAFKVREKASEELDKIGPDAEYALRQALEDKPSAELRTRAEKLLEKIKSPTPPPEDLRALRAVEVLEFVGGAEARQVLKGLGEGAPEARQTREARAALRRLDQRR